jgi:uncharacterized membrane protein
MMGLRPPSELNAWDCWEIGALIWSAFTSVLFYFFTPAIDASPFRVAGKHVPLERFYGAFMSLMMFLLHYMAARTLFERDHSGHILWLITIGGAFAVVDILNVYLQKEQHEKVEAADSLIFADIPMIIAFVIFWFFEHANANNKDAEIFLSGAISFQFVSSTFAFAFIQGGLSRKAIGKVEKFMEKSGLIARPIPTEEQRGGPRSSPKRQNR